MLFDHIQRFFALRKYLICNLKSVIKLILHHIAKRYPAPENGPYIYMYGPFSLAGYRYISICMCVCVYLYIYRYVCVCVCVSS